MLVSFLGILHPSPSISPDTANTKPLKRSSEQCHTPAAGLRPQAANHSHFLCHTHKSTGALFPWRPSATTPAVNVCSTRGLVCSSKTMCIRRCITDQRIRLCGLERLEHASASHSLQGGSQMLGESSGNSHLQLELWILQPSSARLGKHPGFCFHEGGTGRSGSGPNRSK